MSDIPSAVGRKDDAGKLDWTLVPWAGLEPVVRVLMFGAKKYGRDNWQQVPDGQPRYGAALLRHVLAAMRGHENDDGPGGSGLPHLAHAVCCALFLLAKRGA